MTAVTGTTVTEVMAELAALEDPGTRRVNDAIAIGGRLEVLKGYPTPTRRSPFAPVWITEMVRCGR